MAKKKANKQNKREQKVKQPLKKIVESIPFIPFFKTQYLGLALSLVLGFVIYISTINYGYLLDDQIVITKNDYTKKGFDGIKQILTTESFQGYFGEQKDLVAGARYRPLSIVSFAIEHQLFGLNPMISHFGNILLYILTGLILYYLLHLMWPQKKDETWYTSIPFWATALFMAHPVHTEVVANIKGRDEIMALLGGLASIVLFIKYVKTNKLLLLIAALVVLFLGILSKENALMFTALIPIALYLFYNNEMNRGKWMAVLGSLFVVGMSYLLMRRGVIGYFLSSGKPITELMNNPYVEMNGPQKYATIFHTLGMYIKLLFIPHPLSHDYYPYAIPIKEWINPSVILSFLAYVGLAYWGLIGLIKKQKIAFAPLFYLFTLFIVSNIIASVGTFMNERFIYMSSVGFAIVIPFLLFHYLPKKVDFLKKNKMLIVGALGIYTLLFAGLSINRIPVWKDALALNRSAVETYPNSARSNCFMGTALYKQAAASNDPVLKKEILDEADAFLDRSLELYPSYYNALKMKTGVASEYYKIDGDLNKMLLIFETAALIKPHVDHVHNYASYLNGRLGANKDLLDFYYRLGYEKIGLQQRKYGYGIKYLQYGLDVDPKNQRFINAVNDLKNKAAGR